LSWRHPSQQKKEKSIFRARMRQDNRNKANQESKFDFLATRLCLGKIDEGQQKIKIVRTNRQSNLWASCQSIFSLDWHHPNFSAKTNNQI